VIKTLNKNLYQYLDNLPSHKETYSWS